MNSGGALMTNGSGRCCNTRSGETFEPIALEYSVCDLRRNIGGSLDVLGWDHLLDVMVLLDLKTLGRSSRTYSTHAQLGLPLDAHRSPQAGCRRVPDDVGRPW